MAGEGVCSHLKRFLLFLFLRQRLEQVYDLRESCQKKGNRYSQRRKSGVSWESGRRGILKEAGGRIRLGEESYPII